MPGTRSFFCENTATVWKFKDFSPTIFLQKFRQTKFLLKSYTVNWFHEKILKWGKISEIATLCTGSFFFVKSIYSNVFY